MRLVTLLDRSTGRHLVAVETSALWLALEDLVGAGLVPGPVGRHDPLEDMASFLADDRAWRDDVVAALIDAGDENLQTYAPLDRQHGRAHRLLPPIPRPRKNVFCVGLNYRSHADEGAHLVGRSVEEPLHPAFFTKPPTAIVGHEDAILIDTKVTSELDFEVELGVVLGEPGRDIAVSDAMAHVFGYTIVNDISARDLQRRHRQWFKGKSLDTTCPMGPAIVPKAAVDDVHDLELRLRLNGREMQGSNTQAMMLNVGELIAALSSGMTLEAGDIIATGTPEGVGFARTPPVFLRHGDIVEAEISGLGLLRNRVIAR